MLHAACHESLHRPGVSEPPSQVRACRIVHTGIPGHDGPGMKITAQPPTPLTLSDGRLVQIATQQWALERWEGEPDPPDLARTWASKGKFSVNGRRSCAELAIMDHLQREGWQGVWVNAFARRLHTEWFPVPGFRTLAEAGAPEWAIAVFDRLLSANCGKFTGFFDVFAWRGPGEVRFDEAKVGNDRIRGTQLRFVEQALRFHRLAEFTIIEVP